MKFTQYSEIYVAVQDAGVNRILNHIMAQRPSLFNYGSILPATNPRPICREIHTVPQVVQANNPLISRTDPLPIIRTPITLDYIIQLTRGTIDFFPGSAFSLPPELDPPLKEQQFAVNFKVCTSLICQPWNSILPFASSGKKEEGDIDCFCLNLFATGGFGIAGIPGKQNISMNISGIEIPELNLESLEKMIGCYALLTLNQGIFPQIMDAISALAFNAINLPKSMGSLIISASATAPHNPAVEDSQLKVFANLDSITFNLLPSEPTPSEKKSAGAVTRISRPRNRKGTFDFNAAVSAAAFEKIFTAIVKGFRFSKSGTDSYGPFSVNYDVVAHFEGGSLEMRDDGTIVIKELDVKWDEFKLSIGINIPKLCVGGGEVCLMPPYPSCNVPVVGCRDCVALPSYCFFSDSPDITVPIDLSESITSEVTFNARVEAFYGVYSGTPNRWQIVAIPTLPSDLHVTGIADTVGDLFKNRVKGSIDNLLSSSKAPDWAINLIYEILGGIDNIIRNILNIPEDIGKWFIDMIHKIGITKSLFNDLHDYLTFKIPTALEIEDPFQVLRPDDLMIPVKIPIEFIEVSVNSHEIVIKGDVGD
jgi:hypothetical protein